MNIVINDRLTDDIFRQAGKLKVDYKLSLADSIALAQTVIDGATMVTYDHHELDAVERDGKIKFLLTR